MDAEEHLVHGEHRRIGSSFCDCTFTALNACNRAWILSLQDLIGYRAAQHVAGDVPGAAFGFEQEE